MPDGGELRQVLAKIGDVDTRTATDHMLHNRGVVAAGQRDIAGKLLNKALDRRHEAIVKRFSRLKSVDDIRALWNECVDQGDISGAYWAVMSHPVTDKALLRDVFGEVHMLSHLVGSSSRLDLARLRQLQIEAEDKDGTLERQKRRLQEVALENDKLRRRLEALEAREPMGRPVASAIGHMPEQAAGSSRPLDKTQTLQAHAEELAARLVATQLQLKAAEKRAAAEAVKNDVLQRELSSLEMLALSQSILTPSDADLEGPRIAVLYVGGRQNLYDHLRLVADSKQIKLLLHDGGIEDSLSLLPGMVGHATSAIFPVDCISHSAAGLVKRLCRESGKSYVPIRSASLASFAAAIDGRMASHAE